MPKLKFYTFFSIFNIILIILIYIWQYYMGLIFLDCTLGGCSKPLFYTGIAIYLVIIIVKILLPKILSIIGLKYKNSIIDKFLLYIKENIKEQKWILLLAFIFDLPFILDSFYGNLDIFWSTIAYFLIYLGGLFFFYIMLLFELRKYEEEKKL
ncbi:MAG: hypothetical protein NC191_05265 [Muribaculaceae bacterium]|nr:hypothetical protein [Muribaculaceae bacterium]